MPRNKKEGLIFGVSMCVIMVFLMGLLNISIHAGGFSLETLKTNIIAFPFTFIIAFVLEEILVGRVKNFLLSKFASKTDGKNAMILFNTFFIVTMMSFLMTIIGGFLAGDNAQTVFSEFFIRWPRNFWAAMFLNLLVAGPIARFILKKVQNSTIKAA